MEFLNRKLPRLHDYDYSAPGAYFITICSYNKQPVFGYIAANGNGDAVMYYSPIGSLAKQHLLDLPSHYENVKIDNWAVMPNHIHMLIRIEERINPFPTQAYDVPNIVGKYKAAVTRAVGNAFMHSGKLWQTSFYDHIIRNEKDYQEIWQYIAGNPSKWLEDRFYCE